MNTAINAINEIELEPVECYSQVESIITHLGGSYSHDIESGEAFIFADNSIITVNYDDNTIDVE